MSDECYNYLNSLKSAISAYYNSHGNKYPDIILMTPDFYWVICSHIMVYPNEREDDGSFEGIPVRRTSGEDPNFFLAGRGDIWAYSRN